MSSPSAEAGSAGVRPWQQFLDISALSIPVSLSESTYRIRLNLRYFLVNYAVLALLIFLLNLLPRPLTLIFFLCIFAAWAYLVLWGDEPLTLLDYDVDQKIVVGLLAVMTLVALFWTGVWSQLFVSAIAAAAITLLHAVLRAPEETADSPYGSLLNEEESSRGEYAGV